jgi:hypothetical protein
MFFLSSLSQVHHAIQEVVPYDSIFLPENVLTLRPNGTILKAHVSVKAVILV